MGHTRAWAEITGAVPGEAFRVEVDVGGVEAKVADGDFHEMFASSYSLVDDDVADRYVVRDDDGDDVWSFSTTSSDGWTPAEIATGSHKSVWSRWDGEQFVTAEAPWTDRDQVEVTTLADGVVARVTTSTDR